MSSNVRRERCSSYSGTSDCCDDDRGSSRAQFVFVAVPSFHTVSYGGGTSASASDKACSGLGGFPDGPACDSMLNSRSSSAAFHVRHTVIQYKGLSSIVSLLVSDCLSNDGAVTGGIVRHLHDMCMWGCSTWTCISHTVITSRLEAVQNGRSPIARDQRRRRGPNHFVCLLLNMGETGEHLGTPFYCLTPHHEVAERCVAHQTCTQFVPPPVLALSSTSISRCSSANTYPRMWYWMQIVPTCR